MGSRKYILPFLLLLLVMLFSCGRKLAWNVNSAWKRYPQDYQDHTLLYKNHIKGNKQIKTFKLEEFYQQNTNRKLIVNWAQPYLSAYFIGRWAYDTTAIEEKFEKKDKKLTDKIIALDTLTYWSYRDSVKLVKQINKRSKLREQQKETLTKGNWMMRSVGEKPVLLDTAEMSATARQMELYYESKGYFSAKVTPVAEIKNRKQTKSVVTYNVVEGSAHKFNEISYHFEDSTLKTLVEESFQGDSVLKAGDNYDTDKINKERDRLNNLFRDNGYFEFKRQFITFNVDTAVGNRQVDVQVYIHAPTKEPFHDEYTIKEVYFLLDMDISKRDEYDTTIVYDGVKYYFGPRTFDRGQERRGNLERKARKKAKQLDSRIKIRPNTLYSQSKVKQTQRGLNNFESFKFVNIDLRQKDSTNLAAYISASSFKRYAMTAEAGVTVSAYTTTPGSGDNNATDFLPGPAVRFNFRDRRALGGYQILDASAWFNIIGQVPADTNILTATTELGVNLSLTFPKIVGVKKVLPKKWQENLPDKFPKTKLTTGYSWTNRSDYTRTIANAGLHYLWKNGQHNIHDFALFDVSVVDTLQLSKNFRDYLDTLETQGIPLKQSFQPALISSTNFTYIYNTQDPTKNENATFFRMFLESGGSIASIFRSSGQDELKVLGLPFYSFLKANLDYRKYYKISRHGSLAMRLNSGIAAPIEKVSSTLPYEKFFFAGGANSVRGWNFRRLGPGTSLLTETNDDGETEASYNFERPGNIILESSIELRAKIFGYLHGAVFLDAGNVWTLEEQDVDNQFLADGSSTLSLKNFHKQLGWSTGVGLRLDFSFFIFRFDVGVRIWDPGRQEFVPWTDNYSKAYHFGIGYPF